VNTLHRVSFLFTDSQSENRAEAPNPQGQWENAPVLAA